MEIKNVLINGRHLSLRVLSRTQSGTYLVQHDNNLLNIQLIKHDRVAKKIVCRVNGQHVTCFYSMAQPGRALMSLYGIGALYDLAMYQGSGARRERTLTSSHYDTHLVSPLAGRIVRVLVIEGQQCTKGQALVVVESMKMENEICAQHDGFIKIVSIQVGNVVRSGQSLMEFVFDREDGHDADHKIVEKTFEHR